MRFHKYVWVGRTLELVRYGDIVSLKKLLITGATGFLGAYVTQRLKHEYELYALAGSSPIETDPLVRVIRCDLGSSDFERALPRRIDCVVHLAQSRQYRRFPDGAHDMRAINIDATCRLLEWARSANAKRFVLASTANVYGEATDVLTEAHPTKPDSFYAASKLAAEVLSAQYAAYLHLDILRFFTVYGPGQTGMLVPNIAGKIAHDEVVTLAQGVGLYLSPIYVLDAANIVARLLERTSSVHPRILNVCSDRVVTLADIVRIIGCILGTQPNIEVTDNKATMLAGSVAMLRDALGRIEFTDLEYGLHVTALSWSSDSR